MTAPTPTLIGYAVWARVASLGASDLGWVSGVDVYDTPEAAQRAADRECEGLHAELVARTVVALTLPVAS